MSENRTDETQKWLADARLHIAESNFRAAREVLRRLLDRSPSHTQALQLLADINALEKSSGSGLTTLFRVPQKELRDKLSDALDVLSTTYDGIRRDIEDATSEPPTQHHIDDKIRIADIAAIEQCLSEGALDSAQLRLNIALLTFPEDVELKALEVRLRNESRTKLLQDERNQVRQRDNNEAEELELKREAPKAVNMSQTVAATDSGERRINELQEADPTTARNLGIQDRLEYLWKTHWRKVAICFGTLGLLGIMGIVWHARVQARPSETKLIINSSPKNAKVFLNGVSKGTTPYEGSWQIRRSETVPLEVRVELENYEPFESVITLLSNQSQTLTPVLKLTNLAAELQRLFGLAQQAVETGDLTSPADASALAYLNQMKELDPTGQSQPGSQGAYLLSQIKDKYKLRLLQLSSTQRGTQNELSMLETFKTTLDGDDNEINSRITALNEFVQREKQKIATAVNGGNLLSSQPQNALQIVSDLEAKFPREKASLKVRRDEIRGKVLDIAHRKCITDSADCLNFVEMASRDYPDDHELQSLRTNSKQPESPPRIVTDSPPQPLRGEVVELKSKLEEAYKAQRYVAPQSDSAVHYANEVLRRLPDDPRAIDLKQDSRLRAEKEIEQLTSGSQEKTAVNSEEQGRKALVDFQQAIDILAGISYFWPVDARIQRQLADLKTKTKHLQDFLSFQKTYPVIHSHAIGSCKGFLTISPYGLAYVPDMGNHGFDKQFKDIRDMKRKDGGESLEIKIEQRTMTFKINKDVNRTGSISMVEKDIHDIQEIRDQLETK